MDTHEPTLAWLAAGRTPLGPPPLGPRVHRWPAGRARADIEPELEENATAASRWPGACNPIAVSISLASRRIRPGNLLGDARAMAKTLKRSALEGKLARTRG